AGLQGPQRAVLRRQPAGRQGLPRPARLLLAARDAGRVQRGLRLHPGLLRDGLHGRPQEVRRADADPARRRRSDRADRRLGAPLGQARQERHPESLSGVAAWNVSGAQRPDQCGFARVSWESVGMKTNAVRLLEEMGVRYELRAYDLDPDDLTAEAVAAKIGLPAEQVFKTLVARGDRHGVCF